MSHRQQTLGFMVALVAIAACTPVTVTTGDKGTKDEGGGKISVKRSPTPTPAGTPANTKPTVEPTRLAQPPTPKPTPTPTPAPPGSVLYRELTGEPSKDGKTSLKGMVFDGDEKKLDRGPNIVIKSATGEAAANVENGQYVFTDLKVTGDCAITVDQYGFTPRTQHVKITKGRDFTLNFGEPNTPTQVYALQNPPEITSVTPNQYKMDVDPTKIALTLQVSEALNRENIVSLLSGLRLFPLNSVATAGKPEIDLTALGPQDVLKPIDVKAEAFPYFIRFYTFEIGGDPPGPIAQGVKFDPGFPNAAEAPSVDASERILNVSFAMPLLNGQTPATYQLAMVADPKHITRDVVENMLGTDATGKLNTQPPAGQIVNNVFLSPYLSPETFKKDDPNTRWDSTHVNAVTINLAPDKAPPLLTKLGCSASDKGTLIVEKADGTKEEKPYPEKTVIYVEFNEALIVPGPGGPISRESVRKLENYTFAVGQNVEYLAASALLSGGLRDPKDPVIDLKSDTVEFGKDGKVLGKEFRIVPAKEGDVTVDILPYNGVQITILNKNLFYKENAKAIMARVAGIHDPADNMIPNVQADLLANQPRTTIDRSRFTLP